MTRTLPLIGTLGRSLVSAWNRYWFTDVSGVGFGLVRVAFSATLLLTLLEFAPLLADQYTADGYFPISSARQWSWGNLIALFHRDAFDSLGAIVVIYTTLLFATTLLMLGWYSRLAATAVFALLLWFQTRNPTYLNGGDEVLRLVAFYLFLGYLVIPAAMRSVSVDRWLKTDAGLPTADRLLGGTMRHWPLRMIQIQICVLYAVAGAWKLAGDSWWTADAVFYATQNPQTARWVFPAASWTQPFYWVASVGTAWWEFTFPLLYAWRRSRNAALAFGVVLHLGILVTMNIGFFSLAMLATYPGLLGTERCKTLLSGVFGRLGRQDRALELSGRPITAVES